MMRDFSQQGEGKWVLDTLNHKEIINKIDQYNKNELQEIIENIKFKLPKDLKIPIIINTENSLENYIAKLINQYGEILLTLNSIQLADKFFLRLKEQRLKRRQKLAQSTIGKFSTIKASAVALNPFIFLMLLVVSH